MTAPLVHVLVLNWNGREHLQACFESLLAQTYPNARYVLIDNASTDDSAEHVRACCGYDPRVEVLALNTNDGWSAGNNAGIERAIAAGAEYVFLLNNDTAVAPDAIKHLVAAAESDPTIGALAPKMLLFDNPDVLNSLGIACSSVGGCWDIGLGRVDGEQWNTVTPVIGACGGAVLLRVAALQRSGLAPADFEYYLDDLDLSLRIWDAGYRIVTCPQAHVGHKFSATLGKPEWVKRKYYYNTRNRFRLLLRNFPATALARALPNVLLGELRSVGRATLNGEFWRVGVHLQAWLATLAYLPAAWRERREQRGRGLRPGQFLPLVRWDTAFFPGVPLPDACGWYPACMHSGAEVRPMAKRARLLVKAGRLRVTHANCYPRLGATDIVVVQHGATVAVLSTRAAGSTELTVTEGVLEFLANRIFLAEETGEPCDFGGWIASEHLG